MIKIVTYYLTEKSRILSDVNNYVPEILSKKSKRKKDDETEVEQEDTWLRFGYYSTFEGALNRLIEVYPQTIIEKEENKNVVTFKKALQILSELKKEISVKVIREIGTDIEDTEEEKNDKKRKRTKK